MDRRGPLLLLIVALSSGCASLRAAFVDEPGDRVVQVPKETPAQAYEAGVLDLQRGDYEGARRHWDRCLAMSAPDSPARLDCLVARERLSYPTIGEP